MTPILYAITPEHLDDELLLKKSRDVLCGGVAWLQYRDKSNDLVKRERQARALRALCTEYNARLIINDDIELALRVGADGLHLGQGDGDHTRARERLGDHAIFGVTCHDSLDLAEEAIRNGASYVAFGRFFASNTKPDARPAPLSLIHEARKRFPDTQICVIGGITAERAPQLIAEGANTIAVSDAVFAAENPSAAAHHFLTTLSNSRVEDFL